MIYEECYFVMPPTPVPCRLIAHGPGIHEVDDAVALVDGICGGDEGEVRMSAAAVGAGEGNTIPIEIRHLQRTSSGERVIGRCLWCLR
jgi:hypothetical protein